MVAGVAGFKSSSPATGGVVGLALPARATARYQCLDVWRGIACLLIVVIHASFYAKFDAATDRTDHPAALFLLERVSVFGGSKLFFVISGYCIAAMADSTRRKPGATRSYFRRRFWRILPPYWAALLLAIAVTLLCAAGGWQGLLEGTGSVNTGSVPSASALTAAQWVGNLTLTETWRHHVFGEPELKLLGPSWTLCYEQQFYVVCGVILVIAPRRFFLSALIVTLATLAAMGCSAAVGGLPIDGFFFDGRWLLFAAGVFVYYHLSYAAGRGGRLVPVILGLGLATALIVRYGYLMHAPYQSKARAYEYVVGAAFALVMLGLYRWDERLARAKVLRPLAACGKRGYSIYLIHYPFTKLIGAALFHAGVRGAWPTLLVTIPIATAVSLGVGWAFFHLVERRFQNRPAQHPVPAPRPPESPARIALPGPYVPSLSQA